MVLSSFVVFFMIPFFYWSSSTVQHFFLGVLSSLSMEVFYSLGKSFKGTLKLMLSVFIFVCLLNLVAMFPFIFSFTSHMCITLPLSFSLWTMVIIFFWSNFMGNFLSHLIPTGSPTLLMSFMVVVELISNFIRPISLTFRLTANMMAGHLLMSLIGGALVNSCFSLMVVGSFIQILLVIMELGVSVVQAYVFFTLIVLYMSEAR